MRCFYGVALAAVIAAGRGGIAQGQDAPVNVYHVGPDATAPEALPNDIQAQAVGSCGKKHHRQLSNQFTFIVDENGKPRNVAFAKATGTFLDVIALNAALSTRFKPGVSNESPVPVWGMEEFTFDVCKSKHRDDNGQKIETVHLAAPPLTKFSWPVKQPEMAMYSDAEVRSTDNSKTCTRVCGFIKPPIPLYIAKAHYTLEARRENITGPCLISLIVDIHGMPENARITQSIGHGLDEYALEAVKQYRFKPAMRNGIQPVPVKLTVHIEFMLG